MRFFAICQDHPEAELNGRPLERAVLEEAVEVALSANDYLKEKGTFHRKVRLDHAGNTFKFHLLLGGDSAPASPLITLNPLPNGFTSVATDQPLSTTASPPWLLGRIGCRPPGLLQKTCCRVSKHASWQSGKSSAFVTAADPTSNRWRPPRYSSDSSNCRANFRRL